MEHNFNTEIAKKYGILEAVIINYFSLQIKNKTNNIELHDGFYWIKCSIKDLSKYVFVYASERKISYSIKKLTKAGILQSENYNSDKRNRTLCYSFTKKGIDLLNIIK